MTKSQTLAKKLLTVVPPAMRLIREELRISMSGSLTVPQLRILAGLNRGLESVTEIADHLGVSQPAASKMVEGLVSKGLLTRSPSRDDRRRTRLVLTTAGRKLFNSGHELVLANLATSIDHLGADGQKKLAAGLDELEKLFAILATEEN